MPNKDNIQAATPPVAQPAPRHYLITGGAGFLGRNMAKTLLERGHKVRIFDIQAPGFSHEHLSHIIGDICDSNQVLAACAGVDTVFHTASIICLMGGPAASDTYRERAFAINVNGTRNIINACHQHNIQRLVYTSSNNVTFNGTPASDMNQATPYANRIYDLYTETKIIAEQLVLAANGVDGLLTCAIRPGGIYGPENNYMFDRLISQLKLGRVIAMIGDGNAVQDNTYIDNLVHGELLAADSLVTGSPTCGKAYFITDDEPNNNFYFLKPIIEALGYKFPNLNIPRKLLMPVISAWQWLHFKTGIIAPPLSPKEIDKIAITHFSNIKDAQRDMGYTPVKTVAEAMEACIPYCLKKLQES